jgi:hypothetical protein
MGVYGHKVVGVFVPFSCATSPLLCRIFLVEKLSVVQVSYFKYTKNALKAEEYF